MGTSWLAAPVLVAAGHSGCLERAWCSNEEHVLLHVHGNLSEAEPDLGESGSSFSLSFIYETAGLQGGKRGKWKPQLPQLDFHSVKWSQENLCLAASV